MKEFWKSFCPIAATVILLWVLWGWCDHVRFGAGPEAFAGIDALFSGLALAGVVTAVVLQSKELQLQREEMKLSRQEAQKTASANQETAVALGKQIDMQLRAAELAAVSALLNSVNSQLGKGTSPGENVDTLLAARGKYHNRLHQVLSDMHRPFK